MKTKLERRLQRFLWLETAIARFLMINMLLNWLRLRKRRRGLLLNDTFRFRGWLANKLVNGRVNNRDGIGKRVLGSELALGIPSFHDFDFDSKHTLLQEDVPDGVVNKVTRGLTRMDHEAISELHRLGTCRSQLARDDDFAALSARLHDETKNTIAGSANGETSEELVSQALALSNSGQTTELNFLGVELETVLREFEALLNKSGEFTNPATFFAKDLASMCRTNDDLSASMGHTNVATRVTFFREFAGEEFIEFGAENTICDELSLFADLRHIL